MHTMTRAHRGGLVVGLVAGSVLGAALATWLAVVLMADPATPVPDRPRRQLRRPLAQPDLTTHHGTSIRSAGDEGSALDDVANRMAHGDHHVERYAPVGNRGKSDGAADVPLVALDFD